MTAQNKKAKFTYEDYLQTPEDKRYELIDGDLIFEPAPKTRHQKIVLRLLLLLAGYVKEKHLGEVYVAPTDVYFDNENVLEPDILFVSRDRLHIIEEDNIKGAPDLAIEVLSPSSGYRDLVKKKRLYAEFGVKEYWIVDPDEKTVEVYHQSRALSTTKTTKATKTTETTEAAKTAEAAKATKVTDTAKTTKAEDTQSGFVLLKSLNENDTLTSRLFPKLSISLEEIF